MVDFNDDYCDNADEDGRLNFIIPAKIEALLDGEPQSISGNELDERLPARPKNWKTSKRAKNKASRKARRVNRK
jgi:hypothetical protein